MASGSNEPTRRKHRRSSSDDENNDAGAPSKRRKHRHHKHHRHHHRHHRSKKEDKVADSTAEAETEIEMEGKLEGERKSKENAVVDAATGGATSEAIVSGSILGIDYDMEEGEIVDEGEGGASAADGDDVMKEKERGIDLESGDIGVLSCRHSNNAYTEVGVHQEGKIRISHFPSYVGTNEEGGKMETGSDYRINGEDDGHFVWKNHNSFIEKSTSRAKDISNGDFVCEHGKDDLIVEEHGWKNDYSKEANSRETDEPEGGQKRHRGFSRSPSRDRQRERVRSRSHLKSPDQSRGRSRSRSQSIFREGSLPNTPKAHNVYSKSKTRSDSEDEPESSRDYQPASRESFRDEEREHKSNYSRHSSRLGGHHSRETRERDRDRGGSRDVDRDRTRDREREKTREHERERERARELGREREKERERYRDWEWEKERERRRERDRGSSWDRNRDRERDRDSQRSFRNSKHDHDDGGYGEQDSIDDYKRKRHDEASHKVGISETYNGKVDGSKKSMTGRENERSERDENEQEDYQERIVLQLAEQEEDDLERIKEESRRRREAILEKYRSQRSQQQPEVKVKNSVKEQGEQPSLMVPSVSAAVGSNDVQNEGQDDYVADPSFSVGKSPPPNGVSTNEKPSDTGGLGAGTPKSERSNDMFSDDIFGESPAGVRKSGKGDGLAIERCGLHDNWDDTEGYYSYRFGEVLDGRYEIIAAHGKGVFSTVVRARDLKAKSGDPDEVAIKIIRNNETMLKAGKDELVILKKLAGADPENKRHCVRFVSSFKYRNHLCLVFESLHMNLREILKKFGRNIGLKLTAIRAYAKQLFIALKHLKNCGVLHCDIKPDNMLVNEAKNVLKLCDFGNAMLAGENEITPYLVSRFYRAPEIILGLPYDHPMDMWSVGCCLFELYSGKVLFPGATNNDMLRLHMELKGAFPKKMVRKGRFKDQHFDQGLNFLATEEDPVTKKAVRRLVLNIKPKDFGTLIVGSPGEDPKMLAHFKDLLDKIFMLDPDKRITVSQALSHPFITGK